MLDPATVAQLEESRQATGLAEVAGEHIRIAGGCAGRGVPGTWVNYAVGFGMNGEVDPADLHVFTRWHEEKGIEPRLELCPFAHRSATLGLAALGFVLRDWETVLFRELEPSQAARPLVTPPDNLRFVVIDPADDAMIREYCRVSMSGFFPAGTSPSEADFELGSVWARHPRTVCVAASLDGQLVGAGALCLAGEVASLAGLSVLPEFRRRGIQQALIAHRLNLALSRGVRVATIGSRPGAPTERNVRRMGFQTAYTKAILVRPGPGLVPHLG